MSSRVPCYIGRERKAWALTQSELAVLLGKKCRTTVSRLEQCERSPSIDTLLAAEIVFGRSPAELYPKRIKEIEERVLREASVLYESLAGKTNPASLRKKEFLTALLNRAITRLHNQKGV